MTHFPKQPEWQSFRNKGLRMEYEVKNDHWEHAVQERLAQITRQCTRVLIGIITLSVLAIVMSIILLNDDRIEVKGAVASITAFCSTNGLLTEIE